MKKMRIMTNLEVICRVTPKQESAEGGCNEWQECFRKVQRENWLIIKAGVNYLN